MISEPEPCDVDLAEELPSETEPDDEDREGKEVDDEREYLMYDW